jgi:hypothetical protein
MYCGDDDVVLCEGMMCLRNAHVIRDLGLQQRYKYSVPSWVSRQPTSFIAQLKTINPTTHINMVEIQTAIDIKNLETIAARFRDGVEIKDRRYRFVRYRNCFVGSEAVDFMIHHKLASTRDAAVVLGRSIMKEIGSFEHVTRDHPFQGRNNMM